MSGMVANGGGRRVNLAGAATDKRLRVGDVGYLNVAASSSIALNVATRPGELYEVIMSASAISGSEAGANLNPNNTTYAASFFRATYRVNPNDSATLYTTPAANSAIGFSIGATPKYARLVVPIKLDEDSNVMIAFESEGNESGEPVLSRGTVEWNSVDPANVEHTSLGTIALGTGNFAGSIFVKRLA